VRAPFGSPWDNSPKTPGKPTPTRRATRVLRPVALFFESPIGLPPFASRKHSSGWTSMTRAGAGAPRGGPPPRSWAEWRRLASTGQCPLASSSASLRTQPHGPRRRPRAQAGSAPGTRTSPARPGAVGPRGRTHGRPARRRPRADRDVDGDHVRLLRQRQYAGEVGRHARPHLPRARLEEHDQPSARAAVDTGDPGLSLRGGAHGQREQRAVCRARSRQRAASRGALAMGAGALGARGLSVAGRRGTRRRPLVSGA
jgi:hypothetical protein